jgi:hypothetical protein
MVALTPSGGPHDARKLDKRCANRADGVPRPAKRCFLKSETKCGQGRGRSADLRFSRQPRQALCGPAKSDVSDERNHARQKVQNPRYQGPRRLVHQAGPRPTCLLPPLGGIKDGVSTLDHRVSPSKPIKAGRSPRDYGEAGISLASSKAAAEEAHEDTGVFSQE